MRSLRRLLARALNFATGRRNDERLKEEMASHLAAQIADNRRAGMTGEEAYRQAHLQFGPAEAIREDYHAEHGLPSLESVLQDVRYALRVLRKSPAFTAVTLITLTLGIGANVVVFAVLNAVLLRPLEVDHPENLYQLRHKQWANWRLLTTSYPDFEDLQRRNTTFSGMAAINGYSRAELKWRNNAPRDVAGEWVTGNYFDLLGVEPQAGRFFHAADEHGPNSAPYVVLSDALWRKAFRAEREVVGATVDLDEHPFTVVGIAPPQFHGTERFKWPDYWLPLVNQGQSGGDDDNLHDRTQVSVTVIGRIKPGVTPEQATENLNSIALELAKEYPASDDGQPLRLVHAGLFGDEGEVIRGFLWSVTALALLVLLAACANLASLFAARAADRSRELALRMALGSSRRRLARQLLTEAVVVSLGGGAAGLAGAYLLLGLLKRWESPYGRLPVNVDARVYIAGLFFTLASALLFGMLPARQAWQSSPLQMMKGGHAESMHLRCFALRDVLLGVQIAICTLLVTSSLVAVRGLAGALQTPLGIKPQGAMLVRVDLGRVGLDGDAVVQKEKAIADAMLRMPGVTGAGAVNLLPMNGGIRGVPIFEPGTTEFQLKNAALTSYVFQLSPGYFAAAGTRLLEGRDVGWQDTAKTPYVAVVNDTFVRRLWGETPAIGQHFIVAGNLTEVVGVVETGKYHDLTEAPQPAVYLSLSQMPDSGVAFIVRSQRPPSEMAAALTGLLGGIAPNVPVSVLSWSDTLEGQLFPARTATLALGVMGLLAAMLAVTGIFGMAAYSVSRRMKELGIRTALGARRVQVMRAAVGRPLILLIAGSLAGLCASAFANRLLSHVVYQANPRDPLVVAGAVLTMALLGVIAAAVPARRALGVDAAKLMREE